jgi:hypothetical protein
MPAYQYPGPDTLPPTTSDFQDDPGFAAPGPTNPPQYDSVPNRGFPGDPGSQRSPNRQAYDINRDYDAEDRWVEENVTRKGFVIDEVTGDVYDPKAYPPKVVDHMPDFYPSN